MIEEYKELLLNDVCARLPYGVKYKDAHGNIEILDAWKGFHTAMNHILYDKTPCIYLRPMEDMTKDEELELGRIGCEANIEHKYGVFYRCQDYLNSHFLDYRGLIPKGLALKADKNMYDIKTKLFKIFVRIANYAEFANIVKDSIENYHQHTFYTVKEILEHLRGCVKYLLKRGTGLDDEYGYQVPLSDTHEKVYWFKLVDYTWKVDYLKIELYYNGTLK